MVVVTAYPFYLEHNDESWSNEKAHIKLVGEFIASLPEERGWDLAISGEPESELAYSIQADGHLEGRVEHNDALTQSVGGAPNLITGGLEGPVDEAADIVRSSFTATLERLTTANTGPSSSTSSAGYRAS